MIQEPKTYYHVTPVRNVESILKNGLTSSLGVYLFDELPSSRKISILALSHGTRDFGLFEVFIPEDCYKQKKRLGYRSDILDITIAHCNIPPDDLIYLGNTIKYL